MPMSSFSMSDFCCLFCCPPCPGRIASKLAFWPPPTTYQIMVDEASGATRLDFTQTAEWQFGAKEFEHIEVFHTVNKRGNKIACFYYRPSQTCKYTILYSHGNAVDLGQMSSFYVGLGKQLNCNIFSYDYSGYGASTGKPSEKNLYADVEAAWLSLKTKYGVNSGNLILYGQSIGTVPTVDLASRNEVAAVILHSPLVSGIRVACPQTRRQWLCDSFSNIEKVPNICSTVLVIHGTEDDVVDFSHGMAIYERCKKATEPLWIEGAGHNDVELHQQYVDRLQNFINVELGGRSAGATPRLSSRHRHSPSTGRRR